MTLVLFVCLLYLYFNKHSKPSDRYSTYDYTSTYYSNQSNSYDDCGDSYSCGCGGDD